jgi:predicted membrane GTPase involved in stress response
MQALKRGLRPIVVINKVDKDSSRIAEVESELFDLFASLDASEEQLDFPIGMSLRIFSVCASGVGTSCIHV